MFSFFKTRILDQKLLTQVEEELILADLGINSVNLIIQALLRKKFHKEITSHEIKEFIINTLDTTLNPFIKPLVIATPKRPVVILIAGANGSGKTTSIAKLAYFFSKNFSKIMLVPSDTFRAAATEQLAAWAIKLNINIFTNTTKDPAALTYQAISQAQTENYDLVIVDTSGRLASNTNLMHELAKIDNILKKFDNTYPTESILILDGTFAGSSLIQAEGFAKYLPLSGLIITKLDGKSKGGIIIPIIQQLKIPVYFIGIGEKFTDLLPFNLKNYLTSLFDA